MRAEKNKNRKNKNKNKNKRREYLRSSAAYQSDQSECGENH